MLLDLVQPFLRSTLSLEFAEIFILLQVLQHERFGFFTAQCTLVPSLHRLRACIFKLFTPLASFTYVNLVQAFWQPFWRALQTLWQKRVLLKVLTLKYFRSDHNSMRGPKFSENNGPADQFSRNFGPPDQNFRRTKISVTVQPFLRATFSLEFVEIPIGN